MIGDNIKRIRDSKGLGLNELARKSKISGSYLSNIEKGIKTNPSIDALEQIAKALDVEVDEFFKTETVSEEKELYELENKKIESWLDSLDKIDDPDKKLSYMGAILDFAEPEQVVKFILNQPMFMAYGGYDLKQMSNEEIIEVANDMLFAMKLSLEKINKKKNK